jgi:hypothetical protein
MEKLAGIYIEGGMLVVDFTTTSVGTLHRNVHYSESNNRLVVHAEKCHFSAHGLFGLVVDPETVSDRHVLHKKRRFGRGYKKVCKKGWVELKERTTKEYASTSYTIIK